jgi:hypothetical protein
MSNRVTTSVLALLVAILGAISLWLWRSLEVERGRVVGAQTQLDDASSAVAVARPLTPSAPRHGADAERKRMGATMEVPNAMFGASRPELLNDNKEYRDLMQRLNALGIKSIYVDLAGALGISQEQADRVMAVVVDYQLRMAATEMPSDPEGSRSWRIRMEQEKYQANADIAAIIGSSRLPDWFAYTESLDARHEAREIRAALLDTSEPLRKDQVEPLIKILHEQDLQVAEALPPSAQGDGEDADTVEDSREFDAYVAELAGSHERLETAAVGVLSSTQLAALRQMHEDERETAMLSQELFRIQREMGLKPAVD